MKRLTNRKEAEDVKTNAEGLARAGVAPSPIDMEYIELAKYENAKEKVEELTEEMKKLACEIGDPEDIHVYADNLLCRALEAFGCNEIVKWFDEVYKYYA